LDSLTPAPNMKMFVVLALAACAFAEPEADPAVLLGNGVYAPSLYNAGLYSNVVRPYVSTVNRVVSTPLVSSYRYASPLVSALSPVHAIGKREAEAEPEADAQVFSTYAAGVPVSTYAAGLPVSTYAAHHVAAPLTTYNVAAPMYNSFVRSPVSALTTYRTPYVHAIGKREAEAEPEADAQFISTYAAGLPLTNTYAAPISTYTTAAHVATPVSTYAAHVAAPVSTYTTAAHVAAPISTYTTAAHIAAPVTTTYAAQAAYVAPSHTLTSYNNPQHYTAVSNGVFGPKYIAKNGAVQHIVKREAEAQWFNPTFYNTAAVVPALYNMVHAAPHAVAATPFGYTHASNVGICTNNVGQRVAC